MADSPPKKRISERRRQQNVRAQTRYRERQKQHLQALENCLATVNLNPPPSNKADGDGDGQGTAVVSTRCNQIKPLDVLSLIENISDVDDNISKRVRSGEITVEEIFRAGLNALRSQQQQPPPASQVASVQNGNSSMALRTDKILITQNRMQVNPHTLPDIYSSHLRIKGFNNVAAIRANAELLGISFEQMIDPSAQSPFYHHAATETQKTICASKFHSLKPHLQPTTAQIQHPHHPWIDLIPCATFRQQCIRLLSMDPPMIDEEELCEDFENDGLICWGSYLGGHEVTGSGAPWDLRSWEAQPWFLKKWWFLLGGEEGPLFQQSRWWHEMRGDRLLCEL